MRKALLIFFGLFLLSGCAKNDSAGLPNPASVFCEEHGGSLDIVDEEGGQRGICTLSDGTKCDEWAFYRGECPKSDCVCPSGYRKDGEACNPECYYSNPRCMAPSIECKPAGCGDCPMLHPPSPDFCKDGSIVEGVKNECGCVGPPRCEK